MVKAIRIKDNNWHKPDIFPNDMGEQNVFPLADVCIVANLVGNHSIEDLSKSNENLLIFKDIISDNPNDNYVFTTKNIYSEEGGKKARLYSYNLMGFIGARKEGSKKTQRLKISSRFDSSDKDYFLQYLLQKVFNIKLFKDLEYNKDGKIQALDWLMLMFPQLLKKAFRQGIFRSYKTFKYNNSKVRGVIDFNHHIKHNIPFCGKIAYKTREFTRDNPMMQLVRHTIEYMETKKHGREILLSEEEVRSAVDVIKQATPSYSINDRRMVIIENRKPAIHPFYNAYTSLQKLCLQILKHNKLGYGDDNDSIFGVLFDGSWLWEEFISIALSSSFKHYTNKKKDFYLFNDVDQERGKYLWIIPDFLSQSSTDNYIVADAKYIPLGKIKDNQIKADRAGDIYYKTLMYMYRFNSKLGFLFYPYRSEEEDNDSESYTPVIDHFTIEDREDCHFYQIGLKIPYSKESTNDYMHFFEAMEKSQKEFSNTIQKIIKEIQ